MEPFLLVPGLLSTAAIFAPQIPFLWQFGPVTVASTRGQSTIAEIAASILETAPARFSLVGLSMGGYVSFEILRQAPERVLRLALLGASARPDTAEQTRRRLDLLNRASRENLAQIAEDMFEMSLSPNNRKSAGLRSTNRSMAKAATMEQFIGNTHATIGRPDSRGCLGQVSVPTILIVGEDDSVMPPSHSEEIAKAIPGAELHILPRCGHAATIEQPRIVNELLEAWIAL